MISARKVDRPPSLIRYSPALVLLAVAIADTIRLADPDLWGHILFGRAVLHAHHLILYDPYSYSAGGHLWLNHEWLAEVIEAFVFDRFGVVGLKFLKFGLSAITVVFLALAEGETDASVSIQLGLLLAGSLALAPALQFRPQSFTFALFAILIYLIARQIYRHRNDLWIAIPMLAVWANLHGGFIVGIATLSIFTAVTGAQSWLARREIRAAGNYALITLLASAATLATPYGIHTWVAVWHALRDPYTRLVVEDWRPFFVWLVGVRSQGLLALLYFSLPAVMAVALAVTVGVSRDFSDLPLLAVAALMCLAAVTAMRNAPLAVIAIVAPLARHLAMAADRVHGSARLPFTPSSPEVGPLNQALVGIVALALMFGTGLVSGTLPAGRRYPAGATGFMRSHHMHGRILNDFIWGEYLIWHTSPESRVFIDGRYDTVYPADVIRAYLHFHFAYPDGASILKRWPPDYILLPPDDPANRLLVRDPEWKIIYRDADTLLYARRDARVRGLPDAPVRGVNPPTTFP